MEKRFEELKNHSRQTGQEDQNLEYHQTAGESNCFPSPQAACPWSHMQQTKDGKQSPEEPENTKEVMEREPHKLVYELLGSTPGVHTRI